MENTNKGPINIVFILADDLGCWAMRCAGNNEIKTPNLDRIAQTGIRFTNFFCTSPVCSPARASLLTGQIPSQHGIHDWIRAGNSPLDRDIQPVEYLEGQAGYTDVLAQHGYQCGLSGKWHLGNSLQPQKSFTFWQVILGGGSNYYGADLVKNGEIYHEPRYLTETITDNALKFLSEQQNNSQPFYLSLHYTAPHSPWEPDQHPREIYDDYYQNCAFESVPDEPMHPWQINSAPFGDNPETRRSILSGYFAAVTAMDQQIGRVLDWLEENKLRDNTLVIFTSDNGMNMGHHGVYGKGNGTLPQNMYDTSVKVPMLMSHPALAPQNVVCENLLSHYDFMPTLLDYLGLPSPPQNLPGQSFAPLLRGEPLSQRKNVVVYDEYGPVRMIRTRDWKYVHRYPDGPHELYHLAADVDEKQNLINHLEHGSKLEELRGGLEDWFARYVVPSRDGKYAAATGMGQLRPFDSSAPQQNVFADDWYYLKDKTESENSSL